MPIQTLSNRSPQNLSTPSFTNASQANLLPESLDTFLPGGDEFKKRFKSNPPITVSIFIETVDDIVDDIESLIPGGSWLLLGGLGLLAGVAIFETVLIARGRANSSTSEGPRSLKDMVRQGVKTFFLMDGASATGQTKQAGTTGKTEPAAPAAYRLEARVPEGAINPAVLDKVGLEFDHTPDAMPVGQGVPYYRPVSILRQFATLAEMEDHLNEALGDPQEYKSELGLAFRHWKTGDMPTTTRYKTALGETVVVVPGNKIFNARGDIATEGYQFNAHLSGSKKLPPGDYSRYTVQYYFNPDGSFKGVSVERSTLRTRPHNYIDPVEKTVHYQDTLTTDRVASFGEPGQALSAKESGEYAEAVSKVVAEPALPTNVGEGLEPLPESGSPQRGSPTELAVAAALKDWFSMNVKTRREISRLIGIRRDSLHSEEAVLDRDRIEPEWVTSRAIAHLEGRGGTLFSIAKMAGKGLEVTNAGLVFNDSGDKYSLDEVFTLGRDGKGFLPSDLFVNTVADALQGRVGLEAITRDQLVTAVRRAFAERGYHNDNVFGPGYEHKVSSPTIRVVVNGRAMEIETGCVEHNVRDILFTPAVTRWQRFKNGVKDFFGVRPLLGNTAAAEFIPRKQLPEIAMGTDGNLREFGSYPELLAEVHRRLGAPTVQRTGFPSRPEWPLTSSFWTGEAEVHELNPSLPKTEFIEWFGSMAAQMQRVELPLGDIKFVARLRSDLYDQRGKPSWIEGDRRYAPNTAHDVYYFFNSGGHLVSAMVIVKDERSHVPSRVALRMDTVVITSHVSYEQIKFKELVAKAVESFREGDVGRAYDAFARLASGIGQLQKYINSPSVAMALKRLTAAAHEAAGDMAELSYRPDPLSYGRALSLTRELVPEEFASLKARVDEAKIAGGRDVIEQIWTEMGSDWLFRDPLAELEGGTITPEKMARQAVDISAPETGAASREVRTEEFIRTRRKILDAHRKTIEAAKEARKR